MDTGININDGHVTDISSTNLDTYSINSFIFLYLALNEVEINVTRTYDEDYEIYKEMIKNEI